MNNTEQLTAGLAADEQIAQAATSLPQMTPRYPAKTPAWEPEQWAVNTCGDVITLNGSDDPIYSEPYEGGGPRDRAAAEHIANFDPKRVLAQVKAIRRVIEEELKNLAALDGEFGDGCTPDEIRAGRCSYSDSALLEALASIYTEDNTNA